jgi:hypothetical protein
MPAPVGRALPTIMDRRVTVTKWTRDIPSRSIIREAAHDYSMGAHVGLSAIGLSRRLEHTPRFFARLVPNGATFSKEFIAAFVDASSHDRRLRAAVDPNGYQANQKHDASNGAKDYANLEMVV